jgi:hypothetical protein
MTEAAGEAATIPITHHWVRLDRAELLRRRPGRRSSKPECIVVGHAWVDEAGRDGWLMCLACEAVRGSSTK